MEIQRYEQDARMSDIVVYGDMIYLAGQVCTERDGVRAQAEDTLAIIERLLQLAGSDKSKILSVMIYISDMRNLPAFNAVWDAWVVLRASSASTGRNCSERLLPHDRRAEYFLFPATVRK